MAIIPGVYQAKNAISDDSQQGSKFNSIVNAIVNPANTSLLTGFDPVIEEVSNPNVGTVVTYTPHTVSGTPPLALPNSAGQPLQAWSVDLLPYQEGSGDPAPDNVRPIHGTDKVTITTAGKNLCDTANLVRGGYNIGGMPNLLQPNTTYTYSLSGTDVEHKYRLFTGNIGSSSAIRALSSNYIGCGESNTFTTPAALTEACLVLAGNNGTAGAVDMGDLLPQIELGSTATPYTPYLAPSQTVIPLPSTVYTATIGESGGESRWGEVDLGTLEWAQEGGYFRTDSLNDRIYRQTGSTTDPSILCEIYAPSPWIVSGSGHIWVAPSDIVISKYVWVKDDNIISVEDFVSAVTGKKLVYKATTPTTFAVPSVTIPTPTGTATTWATAEDGTAVSMNVTYLGTV